MSANQRSTWAVGFRDKETGIEPPIPEVLFPFSRAGQFPGEALLCFGTLPGRVTPKCFSEPHRPAEPASVQRITCQYAPFRLATRPKRWHKGHQDLRWSPVQWRDFSRV